MSGSSPSESRTRLSRGMSSPLLAAVNCHTEAISANHEELMDVSKEAVLTVLIVERHRTVSESLTRLVETLGSAHVAAQAHNGSDALEFSKKLKPDVAIVDLELSPNCVLLRAIHNVSPETRIIVLADRTTGDAAVLVDALASGAVGAIYKEATIEELARALRSSSTHTPVVADEATGLLLGSYLDALAEKRLRDLATIEALASAVELRDVGTGQHLHRVTELASKCIEAIDPTLAQNEEVRFGFRLHDVGKIGVPDAVLSKPGPLSTDEWDVMKRHPEMGVKIVEPIGFSSAATDTILSHHERWDGTGYPYGLAGDEIPLTARAFALADAYDAMTSDRPYRAAMSKAAAVTEITVNGGRAFDPRLVDVFIDLTK